MVSSLQLTDVGLVRTSRSSPRPYRPTRMLGSPKAGADVSCKRTAKYLSRYQLLLASLSVLALQAIFLSYLRGQPISARYAFLNPDYEAISSLDLNVDLPGPCIQQVPIRGDPPGVRPWNGSIVPNGGFRRGEAAPYDSPTSSEGIEICADTSMVIVVPRNYGPTEIEIALGFDVDMYNLTFVWLPFYWNWDNHTYYDKWIHQKQTGVRFRGPDCPRLARVDGNLSKVMACWNPDLVDEYPGENYQSMARTMNGIEDVENPRAPYAGQAFVIEGGAYVNERGQIFDEERYFLRDGCSYEMHFTHSADSRVTRFRDLVNLVHWNGGNFYHTIVEIVPALVTILPIIERTPGIPIAVRDTQLRLLPLLEIVGVKVESLNLYIISRNQLFYAERIIQPTYQKCGRPSPALISYLRAKYLGYPSMWPHVSAPAHLFNASRDPRRAAPSARRARSGWSYGKEYLAMRLTMDTAALGRRHLASTQLPQRRHLASTELPQRRHLASTELQQEPEAKAVEARNGSEIVIPIGNSTLKDSSISALADGEEGKGSAEKIAEVSGGQDVPLGKGNGRRITSEGNIVWGSPPFFDAGEKDWWVVLLNRPGQSRELVEVDGVRLDLERVFGAERVRLVDGSLPILKARDLFARTRLMVAPHGAGLTNMIFMPNAAVVLELRPDNDKNPCYHILAEACSLRYYLLHGHGTHHTSLTINLTDVTNVLGPIAMDLGVKVKR